MAARTSHWPRCLWRLVLSSLAGQSPCAHRDKSLSRSFGSRARSGCVFPGDSRMTEHVSTCFHPFKAFQVSPGCDVGRESPHQCGPTLGTSGHPWLPQATGVNMLSVKVHNVHVLGM